MNEQSIFLAAMEIADPHQRAAYLDQACAGDSSLRQQVDALFVAHERSGEFLDVPALKQMAGVSGASNPGGAASVERHASQGDIDLSFLQPSTVQGSLGRLMHYEIREVIGRGGCGIVLKAFDEKLQRIVAIKIMAPELAATSPARKRFLREARATAAIRDENVVSIHAVEEQPLPFLVMEYIDGPTLQQKLDQTGPLDLQDVLRIGRQIATGLEAAHAKGLIHRDIKPGNILLEDGTDHVKITDFGLARSADDASMTQSGVITGTPLYMSPEQAQAHHIDHRSDLFSLGSVLYVMCSGRPPFRAASTLAVMKRVVEEQPRPIEGIIPEVPDWLVAIIAKLHAKDPEERFASAQGIRDLLARCQSELEQSGRVSSVDSILPKIPQPANVAQEPVQGDSPKSEARTGLKSASRPARARGRNWAAAAAMILVLLTGLGLTEATGVTNVRGTVIRLFSPGGTLIVEVDDPGISVSIDDEDLVITGAGAKEIRLKPGQYKVLASKDGKVVRQELVTVTRNGRQVVRVSREARPAPSQKQASEANRKPAFVSGDWRLEGDEIVQAKPRGRSVLMFGDSNWTDYDVSVETLTTPGSEKSEGGNLLFRAQSPRDYLAVSLGGYSGTFNEVYYYAGGNWGRDVPPRPTDHETNRWYTLRVQVRDSHIRCWIDGQELFSFKSIHFSTGRVGLSTWNSNSPVRWRNLRVTAPDGKLLWEGFPELPAAAKTWPADAPPTAVAPFDAEQAKQHQLEWADYLGVPIEQEIIVGKDENGQEVALTVVLIPPGEFLMGSSEEERARFLEEAQAGNESIAILRIPSEGPQHRVRITRPFYLGKYEVTQAQWQAVMGNNPSQFKDNPMHPVEQVSWNDIQLFLAKVNEGGSAGPMEFALPTEAQWEYACRAGTTSYWHSGDSEDGLQQFGWHRRNSGGMTHPVGELRSNRFGLYDMHNNVWEWCADWYTADYYAKSPVDDPTGPSAGSRRVIRGGGWGSHPRHCRSAYRYDLPPSLRHFGLAFRLAASIEAASQAATFAIPVTDPDPAPAEQPEMATLPQ